MKKILITGITGFAGSFLTEYFLSKNEHAIIGTYIDESSIHSVSFKNQVELHKIDLNNTEQVLELIAKTAPDEIYHLAAFTSAAESFDNPAETITNNITCELNVLEAVRKASLKTKILVTSSAEVYGNVPSELLPITENTPLRPTTPYAVSKIAQDYLAYQYAVAYDMNVIRVRPFNHIGPRQSPRFVVASFAKQIAEIEKNKKEKKIHVGNLDSKRDFTDVRDIVKAYSRIIDKGVSGEVYNLGSGQSHKISDILDILLSLSHVSITLEKDPALFRPGDVKDNRCNPEKLMNTTGWKPEISLKQTLEDTLEYWRSIV